MKPSTAATRLNQAGNAPQGIDSRSSLIDTTQSTDQSISLPAGTALRSRGYVLLSTVSVNLLGKNEETVECRAILDSGSQLNFITQKKLGLPETPDLMFIEGIGRRRQHAQHRVNVTIQSRLNGFTTRLEAHVLPKIISFQPAKAIDTTSWHIPHNIQLADPNFNHPKSIDLLIGAEIYYSILSVGQISLGKTLPTLQNTIFGWAIAGKIDHLPKAEAICGICCEDSELDQRMERFWRLEETEGTSNNFTTAEKRCETFFDQTTRRDETGRFVVKLPFQADPTTLGNSKDIALQRFKSLERKLSKYEDLKAQYIQFMEEYHKLGHMEEIDLDAIDGPHYFLPHHCVIKPESKTTKLRVVFDASAKTSSNMSLNDILSTGPTIQDDVFSILLRFRMPQVMIDIEDRRYQLIWWRNDSSQKLRCFQLCTVTYGTTSAPYLATKCLQRLAEQQSATHPLAAEILKRDFYVDDVLSGCDNLSTAVEMQTQLRSTLKSAGFNLRKWCANTPRLLLNIAQEDQELQLNFDSKTQDHIKTIGLTWLPKADQFCIKTAWSERGRVTKRTVYSDIAHLFDPLGIMAPVIVIAKIFIQRIWQLKLDWDAALPQELHSYWIKFRDGLKALNDIKFDRHIFAHRTPRLIQFHIFADASERAYGAVAYVRATTNDNMITVRLLCAKSRVAPTRQTTLPRLELCAAKLAAELAQRIRRDLSIKLPPIYLWTDSKIVLAWINATSSSFHTFVANRVASIQQLTTPSQWRHVGSKENPADILSRGITPEKLTATTLWFYGPTFLHGSEAAWPPRYEKQTVEGDLEKRKVVTTTVTIDDSCIILNMVEHKNSFRRLQRIMAYILRFIANAKCRTGPRTTSKSLNTQELDEALTVVVRNMQQQEFKEDVRHLKRYGEVPKNSSLGNLTPFIDQKGVMRVGGRLEESTLPYDAKHPIMLPYSHPLTKILMNDIHREHLHLGPQTLLSIVRQTFWPVKGKILARSVVQHCVQCAKARPKLLTQLMGNLPADRVQPARPFVNTGVDFCGPVWVHYNARGKRPTKAYIAVFCCFGYAPRDCQ